METTQNRALAADDVNYDEAPVAQMEIEDVEYRIDAGRGSAVAVSMRAAGKWSWELVGEGKWDGVRLKAKPLPHSVVSQLERALAAAMRERAELGS
jgi:hypothetical protein